MQLSDAEVITTALVAARFFGGNHQNAQNYLKEHELMLKMLSKSRFNRRLHRLFLPLLDLFDCLGMVLKPVNAHYEQLSRVRLIHRGALHADLPTSHNWQRRLLEDFCLP